MFGICSRCEHFVGFDIEGYVHCAVLGRTPIMLSCRYFKSKKKGGEEK